MTKDDVQYGKYQHYKNKKYYEIIGEARHSETLEELIIYKALYHSDDYGENYVWARPKKMFFELVNHNGVVVPRFKKV